MDLRTVLHKIGKVALYIQLLALALFLGAFWLTGVSIMFEVGWFYQIRDTAFLISKFWMLTIPFVLLFAISPNRGENR